MKPLLLSIALLLAGCSSKPAAESAPQAIYIEDGSHSMVYSIIVDRKTGHRFLFVSRNYDSVAITLIPDAPAKTP